MAERAVRVAVIQMTSGEEPARNLERAIGLLEQARARGAAVAGLPEMFTFMGPDLERPRHAEPLDGPTMTRLREAARRLNLALVAGTIPETSDDASRAYNTCVLIGADGAIAAAYRKLHLFDVDLPGGESYRESSFHKAGADVVTGEAAGLTHGLSVCYDLRFPELYRRLERQGAQLLWAPAAFTAHTGKDHWEVLLRARAVENGCYVAAPAQFGTHPTGRRTYGNAMVVDPWGKVLARAPDRDDQVVTAEVDLAWRDEVRQALPSYAHHVL